MPRPGPRRPLELGRSVIEFRLTLADGDIKALLEAEGHISATIRKALRLYALYVSGALTVPRGAPGELPPAAPAGPRHGAGSTDPTAGRPAAGPARSSGASPPSLADAAGDLLVSMEAGWE